MNLSQTHDIVDYAMTFKWGGMSRKQLLALPELCFEKNVIELGSMMGMSSFVIGTFANRLDCVDAWDETFNHLNHDITQKDIYLSYGDNMTNMYQQFLDNCAALIKMEKIIPHKGKTIDMANDFEDNKYDAIFIDSDHSYKGISEDYYAYENKLKKDGLFIFHDYGSDVVWGGVTKFVKEMVSQKRIEFISSVESLAVFKKV